MKEIKVDGETDRWMMDGWCVTNRQVETMTAFIEQWPQSRQHPQR